VDREGLERDDRGLFGNVMSAFAWINKRKLPTTWQVGDGYEL
jgi:hypothetical protein